MSTKFTFTPSTAFAEVRRLAPSRCTDEQVQAAVVKAARRGKTDIVGYALKQLRTPTPRGFPPVQVGPGPGNPYEPLS